MRLAGPAALWLVLLAVYAATITIPATGPVRYAGAEVGHRLLLVVRGSLGAYAPRARAITSCWTSSVPSPIVRILASR